MIVRDAVIERRKKMRKQLPELLRQHRNGRLRSSQTTQVVVIGGGGTGVALNYVPQFAPDLADHLLQIDADLKSREDCNQVQDFFHLGNGGDMGAILATKDAYPYLRNDGIPGDFTPFETVRGVGKFRLGCSVLVGFNRDLIGARLRKLLERIMRKFRGPLPKRLVVHLVFSWAGGTGSSLGIPLAALVLDAVRAISQTVEVKIVAHCVGGSLFTSVVSTPAEKALTLANTAMTRREMFIAQFPEMIDGFLAALSVRPLGRPLFDQIVYYDAADSGSRVQDIDDVAQRIACNIAVSRNQPLQALEGTRDVNPQMAQLTQEYRGLGPTVIEVQHSDIATVPIQKLATAHSARALSKQLAEAVQPPANQNVLAVVDRNLSRLGLDFMLRQVSERLRADTGYQIAPAMAKLSRRDALRTNERAALRWTGRGRAELEQKARNMGSELRSDAAKNVKDFVNGVFGQVRSAPELAAVAREAVDEVENRRSLIRQRIEQVAGANFSEQHRRRASQLQELPSWSFRGKSLQNQLRRSFTAMLDAETEETALRSYAECFLDPIAVLLNRELDAAEAMERELTTIRQQIDLQLPEYEESIGSDGQFYREVIGPDEVGGVLDQMAAEIPGRMGPNEPLDLGGLRGAEAVDLLIDDLAHQIRRQAVEYLRRYTRHLQGFVEHFGLRFNLEQWLEEALEFTLPAKLDVSAVGPGNAPLRTYLVGAADSEKDLMGVVQRDGNPQAFEYCVGDNPFEIILRAKITGVPFCGIPGAEEFERQYEEIQAAERHTLLSHGSLKEAHRVQFKKAGAEREGPTV